MEEEIVKAAEIVLKSKFVIALTGAGISAESGIPTFRGKDGLWNKYRPDELASPEGFAMDPKRVWEWYNWRIKLVLSAEPNPGHIALAELEKLGVLKGLITQNVDDLHERAGSRNIVKLHGRILRARCTRCDYWEDVKKPYDELPPRCPKCGNLLRPDVVWFGEPIPSRELSRAYELVERADCILVVGTSAMVMPAGAFPSMVKRNNGCVVEINPDETHVSMFADVSIREKAGVALPKLLKLIKERIGADGE